MITSVTMHFFAKEASVAIISADASPHVRVQGLKRVAGLKIPRTYTPRLQAGTKGGIPANPFSGNWVTPNENLTKDAEGFLERAPLNLTTLLGLAALTLPAYLAYKTVRAIRDPYEKPVVNRRTRAAAVHGARGALSLLSILAP